MPAESERLLTRPDLGLSKRRGAFCLVPKLLPIMNRKASLQVQHDGVAIVTLQNPPVNALHPAGVVHLLLSLRQSICLQSQNLKSTFPCIFQRHRHQKYPSVDSSHRPSGIVTLCNMPAFCSAVTSRATCSLDSFGLTFDITFHIHRTHSVLQQHEVNSYTTLSAVLHALFDCLREAHARKDVKAIVVMGSNGKFSAGFDIAEFAKSSGGGGIDSRCAPGLPTQVGLPKPGL